MFLFAVPDVAAVLRLFREARQAPAHALRAYEFFTDNCLARVQRHRKLRSPLRGAQRLLRAARGRGRATPRRSRRGSASLFERGLVTDGTLAQNACAGAELWALREGISESLSATGLPHKNDIALPIAALEAFCAELDALLRASATRTGRSASSATSATATCTST